MLATAGLAAAYTLTKQGQSVVVVERDGQVGGLAKSIEYQGFILDYGPIDFIQKLLRFCNFGMKF